MRMVPDTTKRFPLRPHYEPRELDQTCEDIITSFLQDFHGQFMVPISTDDLTKLIERDASDLDLYADLAHEGPDVEGLTIFDPIENPRVRIAAYLSEQTRYSNRLRTTLTHEYGHVKFHAPFWKRSETMSMFPEHETKQSISCKRDTIAAENAVDWAEWQAGYVCGALLMPITSLRSAVQAFEQSRRQGFPYSITSQIGMQLQASISQMFEVSMEAAKIRLLKLGYLSARTPPPILLE